MVESTNLLCRQDAGKGRWGIESSRAFRPI